MIGESTKCVLKKLAVILQKSHLSHIKQNLFGKNHMFRIALVEELAVWIQQNKED